MTGLDENKVVFHGAVWLGQLTEHLINEIVEEDFGGLIKYSPKGYCMIGVQFCQASYSLWIFSGRNKFADFDIILSNFEIENASAASEVSLSPSGRRKATAPSGAVACVGGFDDGSGGGGPTGDLGLVESRWWSVG